ncbi:hypothetical protein AMATHDRAFT_8957 [Amanita thiersii Skay4041]|uniref:Glutathione S-transferase n=1 Tax=Amanita thiersii Skay4041 TaxID=703135 RepID=A0A2A9NCY1_9AGAR|nr:hypothetical protein AMATHDRAFT_8957 [Amanita thiersii Skay4041]
MANTTKPILLYTASTPNGHAASVLLEEMKLVYPDFDYDWQKIDMQTNEQKEPWFLAMNPNGRIPVMVDKSQGDFPVFETSAILLYLTEHYDKNKVFTFDQVKEPKDFSQMLQWLFFAHGGVGPMQGQAHHFFRAAPEDIPYGKKRYLDETKRLYGVLELRLKDRDYLAGPGRGKFSIADIKTFPWLRFHPMATIETLDEWPNVKAWFDRCTGREGAKLGVEVGKAPQN